MLTTPKERPRLADLKKLTPTDQPALLEQYHLTTPLVDRRALTWALAWIGDDDVFRAFTNTLFMDYSGRRLTSFLDAAPSAELVMFETVTGVAFLAQRSDAAYELIQAGTTPRFWRARISWDSRLGSDTCGLLASTSIQGLGLSGRETAAQVLGAMKGRDLVDRLAPEHPNGRNLAGSVVQSAFYCDLSRRIGLVSLRDTFFHSDGMHDQYRVWTNTSQGAEWMRWYRERHERGSEAQP